MKKRILSLFLALSMVLNMLPSSALTATAAEEGNPIGTQYCSDHSDATPIQFKVKSTMAPDGHEPVGTGTIYICPTCGKINGTKNDWTGDETGESALEQLRSEIQYDKDKKEVKIQAKGEMDPPVFKTVDLKDGCPEHDYAATVIQPTCQSQGYTEYKCKNCGDTYRDNVKPKTGHKWNKGEETTPATCQEDGVITYTCQNEGCTETKTEAIPKDPNKHNWVEDPEHSTEKTCTTDGVKAEKCSNTGCTATRTETIPAGHTWDEGHETKAPSCTVGEMTYTCTVPDCGATKTEDIPAVRDHTWTVSDTATCTENGIKTSVCDDCGKTVQEPSTKLGHDWDEGEVTTEPTCQKEGVKTYTCKREGCGATRTEAVEKLEHVIPTGDGSTYTCENCHKTYDEVQEILDLIEKLPEKDDQLSEDAVDSGNAKAVLNLTTDIQAKIAAIKNSEDKTEEKKALAHFVDETTKAGIEAERKKAADLLSSIRYDNIKPGQEEYRVFWNDNNEDTGKRSAAADFLSDAEVVLSYRIVSEDGNTVVSSGTIASQEDFANAFGFLYEGSAIPEITNPLSVTADSEYVIKTNENMPVSYQSVHTDVQTLDTTITKFNIEYSITLKNPVPDYYIVTDPAGVTDRVTLKNNEKVILTRLATWEANIEWLDDNNRSANGGNSEEARPRPDADALKAQTKVWVYPEGYNRTSGDPVTGDYGYTITETETGMKINLTGLPAYNNEGDPLCYYISQNNIEAANADVVPGNMYEVSYENVGNVASKDNGVYDGGTIIELLTNTCDFTVNKEWIDDKTPAERGNSAKYYIWRIIEEYTTDGTLDIDTEFSYAIANTEDHYQVPTDNGVNKTTFVRLIDGEELPYFPMYDNQGRKYIYLGKEKGVPGEYTTTIDNSQAKASDDVKAKFDTQNNAYFLNGGKIENKLGDRTSLSVSKEFHALSLQNKLDKTHPITATFLLQKKVNGEWVNAEKERDAITPDSDEHIDYSDNQVKVTLTGFTAEDMTDSFGGIQAKKYEKIDGVNVRNEYRFIEIGVSINGVTAEYDPAKWVTDENGNMEYTEDVVVKTNQTSTVLGDDETKTSGSDDTTAIFHATGKNNRFSNQLIGDYQVDIRKYFYDEEGHNIADSSSLRNVEVDFQVYRNDAPFGDVITLTQADLVRKGDDKFWEQILPYDRFDEEGREYRFKVAEVAIRESEVTWIRSEDYHVEVIESPENSEILIKRLETAYVNAIGPGDGLEFDVEKKWLDDSDLNTRHPVRVSVWRYRDADGNLLDAFEKITDTIELNVANNWFKHCSITKSGTNDTLDHYLILEDGIVVNGNVVKTGYISDLLTKSYYEDPEHPDRYHEIYGGTQELGMTGSLDKEGEENWDGLEYRYKLFAEKTTNQNTGLAQFVLTNLRVGTQDFVLKKTWVAGGKSQKAEFGLFHGDEKIGTFIIEKGSEGVIISESTLDTIPGVTIQTGTPDDSTGLLTTEDGNITETVTISGLPKFNDKGVQQEYSIREIKIYDDQGVPHDVVGSSCSFDDKTYNISVSHSEKLAPSNTHRSPDINTYHIDNKLFNRYNLTSNKVWRDGKKKLYPRPDICFSVYRLSTSDPGVHKNGDPDNEILDAQDLADYLATKLQDNEFKNSHRIITDKYWDTRINDYWWTCEIESVPQYDDLGYPYVYFAVENLSDGEVYKGYYCNLTSEATGYRPIDYRGDDITTEKVFDIPNDDLIPKSTTDAAPKSNVFILADGIHKGSTGKFQDYYSATAVNRPEKIRTVTGKKLWKLPSGWVIPEDEMPEVDVSLYRSTEEISYSDKKEDYAAYVMEHAEVQDPSAADTKALETITASYDSNNYRYTFPAQESEVLYPKFDQWGSIYYYYTLEKQDYDTFPDDKIVYEDNDFNITNVFEPKPPFVEISVKKQWKLSPEVIAKIQEYGLQAISEYDFASAVISLYGRPLNSSGEEIERSKLPFRTITMNPKDIGTDQKTDSDGDGEPDTDYVFDPTTYTLTATYKFVDYVDEETKETAKLPYWWLGNLGINYYLSEQHNNGYADVDDELVDITPSKTVDGVELHYNDEAKVITNTYNGINNELTSFGFTKIWDDNDYVDNDQYRPDKVRFVIKRRVIGDNNQPMVDDNYTLTAELTKVQNQGNYKWQWDSGKTLLKYDPSGREYTYFIYSEAIDYTETDPGTVVTIDDITKQKPDRTIGYYYLEGATDDSLTNKLVDEVTVKAGKTWSINGDSIDTFTYDRFSDLRAMGVFPEKVKFVLQRKAGSTGEFVDVPATDGTSAAHKVAITDGTETKYYVGRELDISNAGQDNYKKVLAPDMKWEDLPEEQNGVDFTYRVREILCWADGTETIFTESVSEATDGVKATIPQEAGEDGYFRLTNDIQPVKVKIAKKWNDDNGSQNTRPDSISVKIQPLDGDGQPDGDGLEFKGDNALTAKGNATEDTDANMYYSDEFYIPANVAKTYGTGVPAPRYQITESWTAVNGAEYTQTITSNDNTDGHKHVYQKDGIWIFEIENTWDVVKKTVNLTSIKNWTDNDNLKDITRPVITYTLQYLKQGKAANVEANWESFTDTTIKDFTTKTGTDISSASQIVYDYSQDPKATTASWDAMLKYWPDPSRDGVAEPISYRVKETVIVGNTSYKVGSSALDSDHPRNSSSYTTQETVDSKELSVKNTLDTKDLKLAKAWTKTTGSSNTELTKAEAQKLIDLKAIPQSLKFKVEAKRTADTGWTTVAEVTKNTLDFWNSSDTAISIDSGLDLPRYDRDGNEIQYRAYETEVKYKGDSRYISLTWNTDNSSGTVGPISTSSAAIGYSTENSNFSVSLSNDYKYTSLEITKTWRDENNRDKSRRDVTFVLYRDDSVYSMISTADAQQASRANEFCTVTKNDADNTWTVKWEMLPMYQKDKTPVDVNKSVYTWLESRGAQDYRITYETPLEDGSTSGSVVYNTYQPKRGKITATKNWLDLGNLMDSEPDDIYLKLQYKDKDDNWVDVTQNTLSDTDGNYHNPDTEHPETDGYTAYTTSTAGWRKITKTDNWNSIDWENLPLYMNATATGTPALIQYRVIEGNLVDGNVVQGAPIGYSVAYETKTIPDTTNKEANISVKNTKDITSLTVTKNWSDTPYSSLVRPASITYEIEYQKTGDTDWSPLPQYTGTDGPQITNVTFDNGKSYVVVTGNATGTSWSKTVANLPYKDADGVIYKYRVTETKIHYSWGDVTVTNEGSNYIVGPYDITDVTKTATYSDTDKKYSVSNTNTVSDKGKLKISKTWTDGDNRDGGERTIRVQLYRLILNDQTTPTEQAVGDPVELSSTNSWTYTWENLPRRDNDAGASTAQCVYFVRELTHGTTTRIEKNGTYTGANNVGFTVTYNIDDPTPVNDTTAVEWGVTNTHTPEVINVQASKKWEDENANIDVRPTSVQFKLQYSVDGGTTWEDFTDANLIKTTDDISILQTKDAATVYMVGTNAAATKTLNSSNSWKVQWDNLTAYVMKTGESTRTAVKYRAVEVTELKNYTTTEESAAVDVATTGLTADTKTKPVSITNTLILGDINIAKKFTENGSTTGLDQSQLYKLVRVYKVLPEKLKVTLSNDVNDYTVAGYISFVGNDTEKTGYFNTCKFNNLPVKKADGTNIKYTVTDEAYVPTGVAGYDFITYGTTADVTLIAGYPIKPLVTNDFEAGSLTVKKKWTDAKNRDNGRKPITVILYRDGVQIDKQELNYNSDETKSWTYTWTDLPVYQSAKDVTDGQLHKSVYTIKEEGETEDGTITGANNVDYEVTYTQPSAFDTDKSANGDVTNTHAIDVFDITAKKHWEGDGDDPYGQRPDVTLKLQYSLDGGENWNDVAHVDAVPGPDADTTGTSVFTTSSVTQTLTASDATTEDQNIWGTAEWKNVPAHALNSTGTSTLVQYRVVETIDLSDAYAVDISPASVSCNSSKSAQNVDVTNTIDADTFSVEKAWNDITQVAKPDEIKVVLQYRAKGTTDWVTPDPTAEAYYATLKADSNSDKNWKYTWTGLSKDYDYQAIELRMVYKVEGGSDIVVTPGTGDKIGVYDFSYSTSSKKTKITNKLIRGSLSITKAWKDGQNRDTKRPSSVTFKLFRDGTEYETKTVTVAADGSIDCTFTDLPVYSDPQGTTKSKYTVQEVLDSGSEYQYEVAYPEGQTYLTLNENTEGKYVAATKVTNKYTPEVINVKASKTWTQPDQDKINVRPESVTFKLQYSLDGGTTWVDFTDDNIISTTNDISILQTKDAATVFMVGTNASAVKTLTEDTDGNWKTQWDNLTAYVIIDGVKTAVKYQAVETELPNYTNSGATAAVDVNTTGDTTDPQTKSAGDISNTLTRGSITVTKKFTANGSDTALTGDQLYKLVKDYKVLPEALDVTLSYQNNMDTEHPVSTETKTIRFDETTKAYTTCTFTDLPIKDANGTPITYTVKDSAEGFDFIKCAGTNVKITDESGVQSATVTNDIETGSLTVKKNWHDSNNRDQGRLSQIKVYLYRDKTEGSEPIDEQILNAANDWTYTWTDLPIYQKSKDATDDELHKSVYTIHEDGETSGKLTGTGGVGYDVTYSQPSALNAEKSTDASVTNKHDIYRFNIEASKNWIDGGDPQGYRPEGLTLKIQYSLDGTTWNDFEASQKVNTVPDPKDDDGTLVFTTSDITQTYQLVRETPSWEKIAKWENLPAYVKETADATESTIVYYRVVEVVPNGYFTSDPEVLDYETLKEGSRLSEDNTAETEVTNTLKGMNIVEVEKTWNSPYTTTYPDSIQVQLQYRESAQDTWKNVPNNGLKDMTKDPTTGKWKVFWENLNGSYEHRVIEVSMTYGSVVYPATAAPNDPLSGSVGGYDFTSKLVEETDDQETETHIKYWEITNTLKVGKLAVTKTWEDAKNRDDIRPEKLIFHLYRDDVEIADKTVNVTADGIEECVFDNLPIYKDGTLTKSKYRVTEKDINEEDVSEYTTTYASAVELDEDKTTTTVPETPVTNKHEIHVFNFAVTKTWDDDMNFFHGLRPEEVTLKLQYSVDGGETWNDFTSSQKVTKVPDPKDDDGTVVFTTSDIEQKLTASDAIDEAKNVWGTARWENLPEHVLVNGTSTSVYYRAVETGDVPEVYTSVGTDPVSYESAKTETDLTVDGDVKNTLDKKTSVEVEKTWTGDVEHYVKFLPDSIRVKLQYATAAEPKEADWKDVQNKEKDLTADNSWKAEWKDLRADYKYRVIEVSMTYGTTTITADPGETLLAGSIGSYDFTTEVQAGGVDKATTVAIENKLIVGKVKVTKTWEDGNDRDDIRPKKLVFHLYRDGEEIKEQTANVTAKGIEDCVFDNLPVFKDGTTTKSVYYVTENSVDEYETSYKVTADSAISLDQNSTKETAVTNKHEFYVFNFDVTKTWNDNTNFYGLRPDEVTLKLQYRLDGETTWKDFEPDQKVSKVPDPKDDDGTLVFTTSDIEQNLKASDAIDEAKNVWGTASWHDLPAYALNSEGESKQVYYRAVEAGNVPEVYASAETTGVNYEDAKKETDLTVDGDVKNTLDKKTSVEVEKIWAGDVESYVKLLPDSIRVKLQYTTAAEPKEADWKDVPKNNEKDLVASDNWKTNWKDLRADYKYRVIEVSMTYGERTITADPGDTLLAGSIGSYDFTTEVKAGGVDKATTVAIENKLIVGKIKVTKTWEDANDRDDIRPEKLVFHLYRDGVEIAKKTATVNAKGIEECVFDNLPVLKDGTTTKSVYYVTEDSVDEYKTSYKVTEDSAISLDQDETKETAITNGHEIHLFAVQTTKFWEDNRDPYGLRPKEVVLKIQWTTKVNASESDWADVAVIDAVPDPSVDDGTEVFTTSELKQKLTAGEIIGPDSDPEWGTVRWENLPANVLVRSVRDGVTVTDSQKVYYRVVEDVNPSEAYGSKYAGPVSYDDAKNGVVDLKGENGVKNTLEKALDISVNKTWLDDDQLYQKRPDSIKVQLQYREDKDSAWKDTPETTKDKKPYNIGTQYLTADNKWQFNWSGLRADYEYRVIEKSMIYGELEIAADPIDDGTSGQIAGYSFETKGTAKPGSDAITDYEITNTIIAGEFAVTKSWTDCTDRDGLRPGTLTFELYRDVDPTDPEKTPEPIATKEVKVTKDGIEACVFDKLPVYKDASKELSRYYIVEKDVDGYETSYEVTPEDPTTLDYDEETKIYKAVSPIDNRHESLRFNIQATKKWEDEDNYYSLRPDSVDLKLVYAFDPETEDWTDVTELDSVPGPETDDGTVVFTTSKLVQTLTAADALEADDNEWGTVRWENLPGFALAEEEGRKVSRKVYYKVVEAECPSEIYGSIDMGPVSYDDAKESETFTVDGTVANPYTGITELVVEKNWIDNKQKQLGRYIATRVNVELQYRENASEEWETLPANSEAVLTKENGWSFTWKNLPDHYTYRCVETSFQKGKTVFGIGKVVKDNDYTYSATIGEFASIAETEIEKDSDGNKSYHTVMYNRLNEHPGPKTGDEDDFGLYGSLLATSFFALVAAAFVAKKSKEEEMAE